MGALPARYVSRSSWGARKPASTQALPASVVDEIVFHYSGMDSDEQAGHAACAGRVRAIQAFHMDDPDREWSDIAYSLLVCKHGYVFEGRGIERRTAATGDDNDHTLAICFLGDDTAGRDDVTNLGRQGLVDATRYVQAARPRARKLSGHRDHMTTSCPGDEIEAYIKSPGFRKQLQLRDTARLATLRKWILARRAERWGWKRIKASPNWREFRRLGGR